MTFYRRTLIGLCLAGLPSLASAQTKTPPACDTPIRTADVPPSAAGDDVRVDLPMLPIGTLVSGTDIFCTETMLRDKVVRRWHERGAALSRPIRIDHFPTGMGIALGSKAAANFPSNDDKKNRLNESFQCSGRETENPYNTGPIIAISCTIYPGLVDGEMRPVTFTMKASSYADPTIETAINVRAFNAGTYAVPDRNTPIEATIGDISKSLYFVSGIDGMSSGALGGHSGLHEDSGETLIQMMIAGQEMTLRYKNYDGTDASLLWSQADSIDAATTVQIANETMRLIQRTLLERAKKD